MKLSCVTITGADDSIDVEELFLLSERFPFVEWGILCSEIKSGSNRFPSINWLDSLSTFKSKDTKFSAHLCGIYAKDVIFQNMLYLPLKCEHLFQRVQLNVMQKHFHKIDFSYLNNINKISDKIEWICQYRGGLQDDKKIAEMESYDCFSVLYDISGGKGVSPSSWIKPFEKIKTGYAGGLSPNNLEKELANINELVDNHKVWIDMESGVRTSNDKFDLSRVKDALEIAERYYII